MSAAGSATMCVQLLVLLLQLAIKTRPREPVPPA
jgi:hypothetical protein